MIYKFATLISLDAYTVGLWLITHDTHWQAGLTMCLAAVGTLLVASLFPAREGEEENA